MKNTLKIYSIRLNYIMSLTRMLLSLLTPLVILPYINKCLSPESIGKVDFVNSITSYYILFVTMGIPTYGMREIARVRDDIFTRSQVVFELTVILCINVIVGYVVYFFSIFFIPGLNNYIFLLCIVAPVILLSSFNYDWFYIGIENQVYITVRYCFIKIIQIIFVFLLIKKNEDYVFYALIIIGMEGLSAIFNIIHLHKYLQVVPLKKLSIRRHYRPIIVIFSSAIASSIYAQLDVVMLGFFSGDKSVGLYTTANKFIRMVIGVVTALCMIVVPRLENSLKNNDYESYKKYLNLVLHYVLFLALPCVVCIISFSNEIILFFAGEQYIESVFVLCILSPIVLVIGLSNFLGMGILYTIHKEKQYTICVLIAAIVNVLFNLVLIPKMAQKGAAIGTLIAELVVFLTLFYFSRFYIKQTDFLSLNTIKYFISTLGMYFFIKILNNLVKELNIYFIIKIAASFIIYGVLLFLLREVFVLQIVTSVKQNFIDGKMKKNYDKK